MISKKSEKFVKWIERNAEDIEDAVIPLIVELEQSARLLEHVYALTGDLDIEQAKRLFVAVRELEVAYEGETS